MKPVLPTKTQEQEPEKQPDKESKHHQEVTPNLSKEKITEPDKKQKEQKQEAKHLLEQRQNHEKDAYLNALSA